MQDRKPDTKHQGTIAVQAALDEFAKLGRSAFLKEYGFGRSRQYLVRDPRTGALCDSKAIVGVARRFEYPNEGPLKAGQFSGGEAHVAAKLRALGFEVVRIGEDWTAEEIHAVVIAYFDMLLLEARQQKYNKSERNAILRRVLDTRSKASVEMKHQNISAVLDSMGLPFISGYKPRSNTQLLLRQMVQKFVLDHSDSVRQIVDAMEEVKLPSERRFEAILVDAPSAGHVAESGGDRAWHRLPRRVDYAARDENKRKLGRAGEQWVLEYEHLRLRKQGLAELFARVVWVSDNLGDGTGYDILSFDSPDMERYIEVKTTNGSHASPFVISRNELDFAREVGSAFYLYRVFQFRDSPRLYILRGDLATRLHLEPMDYRASFRRLVS